MRIFHRGQLIKVHPRQEPGHRSTDPDDLPAHKTVYAMRDLDRLQAMAGEHGPAIGAYASALLRIPLPWTKMRQVYALLGLVKKWGPERVDAACASALEHETINVGLIGRMLERGTEHTIIESSSSGTVIAGRFARDTETSRSPGRIARTQVSNPVAQATDGSTAAGFVADRRGQVR